MADARALYRTGFEHFKEGRLEEAAAAYREAVDTDPAFADAWRALAMTLARQEDLDGAVEAARRLVELEPDDPLSHTSLSMAYMRKGLIDEAEQEKATALRLQMQQQGRG